MGKLTLPGGRRCRQDALRYNRRDQREQLTKTMSAELAFNRNQDVDYGVAQEVGPGIRRIVANNPGPYTFLGTNSYIVGSGEVAVIDPGPADERHLKAVAAPSRASASPIFS